MNRNCIIVDDEPLARNLLSEYVKKVPELELLKAFGNPLEASTKITEDKTTAILPEDKLEEASAPTFLFIKDGRKLVKVNLADIQYIEGMKDYVRIHTPDRKITSLQRMKSLAEELPTKQFIRVHHSYIVGAAWIDEIERERIFIGRNIIPVSDTYRKPFQEFIENQQFL